MKKFIFILFCLSAQVLSAQHLMPEHPLLKRKNTIVPARKTQQQSQLHFRRTPLKTTDKQEENLPQRVDPLVAPINRWHQYSAPYWNHTPLIEGEHCPAGCVALSQAQVMHYWKHPAQGEGEHSYEDSTGCKQILYANFENSHYEWDKMLYEYPEGEYTDEDAERISHLLSDCGISVNMRYQSNASGARTVMQPIALVNYFKYSKAAQIHFRDFYTKKEITTMLKRELAAKRPVLISAYNQNGGHSFVLDGYDEYDRFHIMVGNPFGKEDGWTTLECMNGDYDEYNHVQSPELGMNVLQMFIIGIQPKGVEPENETHVFAMQGIKAKTTKAVRGEAMEILVQELGNIGYNMHDDSVAIMLTKDERIVDTLYTYDRTFELEEVEDTAYTDSMLITINGEIPAGEYRIQAMFRDQGTWHPVLCNTGIPNYLLCSVGNGEVELSSDTINTAWLELTDIDIPDLLINAQVPDFSFTIKNHNTESSGRIYFKMEPTNEEYKSFYLYQQGYTLGANEERTYRVNLMKRYAPKTGEYRLRVLYNNNLMSDEQIELLDEDKPIYVSILHGYIFEITEK